MKRVWVRCARCGMTKHRSAVVYSRFTGNFYCFDSNALPRCEAVVRREREWLANHFDTPQGVIFQ
jgi:hypothetical protein